MNAVAAEAGDARAVAAATVVVMGDKRLDRLTAMLVRIAGADVGGISMIHRKQIWLPSHVGVVGDLLERSGSFCNCAQESGLDWFEVEDAERDARFAGNPLVTGMPGYRHYAAVPIRADALHLRGTVWVMWREPGRVDAEARESLRLLAGLAVETLALRYRDETTGIVNRTFFVLALQRILEDAQHDVTVGYINLRAFARLNNVHGQEAADRLLAALGGRLAGWGGADALIAHLGGDRFGFALAGDAGDTARRLAALHRTIELPFELVDGATYATRARVGLRAARAGCTRHAAVLLQEAAAAAASLGTAATRSYDSVSRMELQMQAGLCELLSGRPGHGELEVHYEPQFDLGAGRLTGLEALVRWRHPDAGLLLPKDFLGLAEKAGKMLALDLQVMRQVCRDVSGWLDDGVEAVPIALNFARESLLTSCMPETMAAELKEYGLDGDLFECEITESQCVDTLGLQAGLRHLRGLGLRVAIDDFGSGYSNLETIRQLSFDKLKIDRQFVDGVADDERLAGLVRMIVSIGRLFGAELLCEGVERARDLEWLSAQGILQFQGWYFSQPLRGAAVPRALRELAFPCAPLGHEALRAQARALA
jgi:predicted signal transduction protein with EAL and GGDEF domain